MNEDDPRNNPELNQPVPVAEDNPEYFASVKDADLGDVFQCKHCLKTSVLSTIDIKHDPHCTTWLRMRLEPALMKHPKLKFQLTRLTPMPASGSYPVYRALLVAPFIFKSGSYLEGNERIQQADARAPITMRKSELNDPDHDAIFRNKRIEATHTLLDFVEAGKIPAFNERGDRIGDIDVIEWGLMSDLTGLVESNPELSRLVQPQRIIIPGRS